MASETLTSLLPWLEQTGAWLLTYLLHSSVLLGALWLVSRYTRRLPEALKDSLWKCAVFGGLITASVQVGMAVEPWSGRIGLQGADRIGLQGAELQSTDLQGTDLQGTITLSAKIELDSNDDVGEARITVDDVPEAAAAVVHDRFFFADPNRPCLECEECLAVTVEPRPGLKDPARAPGLMIADDGAFSFGAAGATPTDKAAFPAAAAGTLKTDRAGLLAYWPVAIVGICLALSALALFRLLGAFRRLNRLLQGRREIQSGPLHDLLASICRKAEYPGPVRLTVSDKTAIPLAVGIFKQEICLPERAVSGLSAAEQRSMLAHELAHLTRRDPAWLACFRFLESLLVFQPLNRVARTCWLEAAEYRCDAWAARQIGGGVSLARCLTRVAGWLLDPPERMRNLPAHGMAQSGTALTSRVSRLLDGQHTEHGFIFTPLVMSSLPAGLLIMVLGAPGAFVSAVALPELSEPDLLFHQEPPDCPLCSTEDMAAFSEETALLETIAALDLELIAVEAEVSSLNEVVVLAGLGEHLNPLLEEMALQIRIIKGKRARIQSWIDHPEMRVQLDYQTRHPEETLR